MKDILAAGINCYGIDNVSEAGLLVDGCDYYRAFWTAAAKAESYILLSGWQFDSDVRLLRDDGQAEAGSTLLSFLNRLCENNPVARVHSRLELQHDLLHRSGMAAALAFQMERQ